MNTVCLFKSIKTITYNFGMVFVLYLVELNRI